MPVLGVQRHDVTCLAKLVNLAYWSPYGDIVRRLSDFVHETRTRKIRSLETTRYVRRVRNGESMIKPCRRNFFKVLLIFAIVRNGFVELIIN